MDKMSPWNTTKRIISFVWIIFLSAKLMCASQEEATIDYVMVDAVLFGHETLQLNVSWRSRNIDEKTFDIHVTPLENQNCLPKPCVQYGLPPFQTQSLIPQDPMPTLQLQDKECAIEPGCTYVIEVKTANTRADVTYTVPECVAGVCSCRHSLPTMEVSAEMVNSKVCIHWNFTITDLPPAGITFKSISIDVGIQTNSQLTWGGAIANISHIDEAIRQQSQGNVSANFPSGHTELMMIMSHTEGSRIYIRGHLIDSMGCRSPDGNFTVNVARSDARKSDDNNYMWIFGIIAPIILLILALIYALQHIIKTARKTNAISNWQGVYHNVPSGGGIPHITMQDNFLYVDRDILEARSRGEADLLELPHSCLTIGREIGKGAFGRVFIARADNICGKPGAQVVAVKQLKKRPTPDELEEFLSEITMMKSVSRHPNVVALLGCCTIKQPLLMIMEFVGCGDLLQYLRQVRGKHEARSTVVSGIGLNQSTSDVFSSSQQNIMNDHQQMLGPFGKYLDLLHSSTATSTSDSTYVTDAETIQSNLRPSVTETLYTMLSHNPALTSSSCSSLEYVLDHKELHNFATQIGRGMKHLHERQITHRDLAARNILIDENKTLKISDFGLSRSGIYVNTRNKKVPLRWLSLEAMRDNLYSSKSDVWAFGVLLWEIGTLGGFPYPTVSNHELLAYLASGQRLQRPENCSEHLYELMLHCWAESPDDRPEFSDVVQKLEPVHQKIYVDFNDLSSDYVFPPTIEQLQNNNLRPGVKLKTSSGLKGA